MCGRYFFPDGVLGSGGYWPEGTFLWSDHWPFGERTASRLFPWRLEFWVSEKTSMNNFSTESAGTRSRGVCAPRLSDRSLYRLLYLLAGCCVLLWDGHRQQEAAPEAQRERAGCNTAGPHVGRGRWSMGRTWCWITDEFCSLLWITDVKWRRESTLWREECREILWCPISGYAHPLRLLIKETCHKLS